MALRSALSDALSASSSAPTSLTSFSRVSYRISASLTVSIRLASLELMSAYPGPGLIIRPTAPLMYGSPAFFIQ